MADIRPSTSSGNRIKTPPNDGRRSAQLTSSPRPKAKDSNNTLCRNITIYGYCRFEGKGCAFNHDPHSNKPSTNGGNTLGRGKFNVDSPAFTPSTPPKNLISPKAAGAAPFTPKGTATPPAQPQFQDGTGYGISQAIEGHQGYNQNLQHAFEALGMPDNSPSNTTGNPYEYTNVPAQVNPYAPAQHDVFYQPTQQYQTFPLQYHLYAPASPYPQKLLPFQRTVYNFFMSDNHREELQRKSEATLQTVQSTVLPAQVNEYHSLLHLDLTHQKSTLCFGYPSWVYKAFSADDGFTYALRRVEGFRLTNENDIRVIQRWKKVICANIVTIHNAWTTTKFGDSSIVFVYDYHPLSKTLAEQHFGASSIYPNSVVPENILWSYIVQLTNAIKTIHSNGLAAKGIEPSKIIVTSKMRIRLNCCGMLDVLRPDTRTLTECQLDDFISLGRLILCLACNSPVAAANPAQALEMIAAHYSAPFHSTLTSLLSGAVTSIDAFSASIAPYILQNLNAAFNCDDSLEQELGKELENGRLVRLMAKLGFITERPEFDHDPRWSETGDRYYIKLFRDYVFHSVDDAANPVVDLAHVITCLNKLDAGVDEKIMLVSRDSLNCFVASYKEVKRMVENTFQELLKFRR